MKKKKRPESHGGDERYIVTYADLLTLLLAFFVILYSMSTPDEQKIQQIGGVFETIFKPRVENIAIVEDERFNERTYREPMTDSENKMMKAVSEQNNLRNLQRQIDARIQAEGLEGKVRTELKDFGLKITLTNEVLFNSGSAALNNNKSIKIIDFVGELIVDFENNVSVEGHTDNVPIGNAPFDSNWDLSSARAISVLQEILQANPGLNPSRFSATGYGEYLPVDTNATVEGKAKNRRVEIIVERMHSDGLLQPEGGK